MTWSTLFWWKWTVGCLKMSSFGLHPSMDESVLMYVWSGAFSPAHVPTSRERNFELDFFFFSCTFALKENTVFDRQSNFFFFFFGQWVTFMWIACVTLPMWKFSTYPILSYLILSYLSCSLADRWGTTVDFTTSFLHSSRFSDFCCIIFHSRPVHSLMLSSHRFLCLPLRLPPWTVPCRIVLAYTVFVTL